MRRIVGGAVRPHLRRMKPLRLAVLMGCLTLPALGVAQERMPPAAPPSAGAPEPAQARATTIQNLRAASQGEADAVHRYELFAQRAEQEGYSQVAKLFRAAAVSERIHLRNHHLVLRALGEKPGMPTPAQVEVRTTRENLLVPIEGERGEATQTYPRYARQAELAQIPAAARSFQYAGEAEQGHELLFQAALRELGKNPKADYLVETESGKVTPRTGGRVASVATAPRG